MKAVNRWNWRLWDAQQYVLEQKIRIKNRFYVLVQFWSQEPSKFNNGHIHKLIDPEIFVRKFLYPKDLFHGDLPMKYSPSFHTCQFIVFRTKEIVHQQQLKQSWIISDWFWPFTSYHLKKHTWMDTKSPKSFRLKV